MCRVAKLTDECLQKYMSSQEKKSWCWLQKERKNCIKQQEATKAVERKLVAEKNCKRAEMRTKIVKIPKKNIQFTTLAVSILSINSSDWEYVVGLNHLTIRSPKHSTSYHTKTHYPLCPIMESPDCTNSKGPEWTFVMWLRKR